MAKKTELIIERVYEPDPERMRKALQIALAVAIEKEAETAKKQSDKAV